MKVIQGNGLQNTYKRKGGNYCRPAVYFWGFTLKDDCSLPTKKEELVIYYIGKSKRNVCERLMQEFTQLIFGGFGTIIDKDWLKDNYNQPLLKHLQDRKTNQNQVLYTSEGLDTLYDFFTNKKIVDTVSWMKERLIFSWIECEDIYVNAIEKEMHGLVRTNVFGVGLMKNLKPKSTSNFKGTSTKKYFDEIDWTSNTILKDWITEVHNVSKTKELSKI